MSTRRVELFGRIAAELDRAYAKHGREQWSRHEFYGILKEEVDELWDNIKSDAPQELVLEEAMQVAAMVFRYYETRDRYREPAAPAVPAAPTTNTIPYVPAITMPYNPPHAPVPYWNPPSFTPKIVMGEPTITYNRCVH